MADVLPSIGSNRDLKEILVDQNDLLERIDRQVVSINTTVVDVFNVLTKQFDLQKSESEALRLFRENQEFMAAEALREQRESARRSQARPSATPTSDGGGFGLDDAVTAAAIGGASAALTGRGGRLRRLAGRILRGGGLIGLGALFGEQIGNFLGDELEYWAENVGLDEDFANEVGNAARSSTQSAIIGGGITRLLFRRTLPGIIGGIIFDRLGLDRLFEEGGPEEIAEGINEFFRRLKDGELTNEDMVNAGITGAAAVYAGRQIQRGGEALGRTIQRTFPSFNPDGTVQGEGQAARGGNRNTYIRPRRPNGQFMSDAEIEEQAKALQSASDRAKIIKLMKGLGALGIVISVADFGLLIMRLNAATSEAEKQQLVGAWVGQFIGGAAGLAAGAYIGAFGGPWGAVIGGLLGGAGGALAGDQIGILIAKWAWNENPPAPSIGGISSQADVDAYLNELGLGPSGQSVPTPQRYGPNDLGAYSQYLQPQQMSYNPTATPRSSTGRSVNDLISAITGLTDEIEDLNTLLTTGTGGGAQRMPTESEREFSTILAGFGGQTSTVPTNDGTVLAAADGQVSPSSMIIPASLNTRNSASGNLSRPQQMALDLFNAFQAAGFTESQADALVGEVFRENAFQERYIYGTHTDPANRETNAGIISWQGPRKIALYRFLGDRGLLNADGTMKRGYSTLVAQAEFLRQEMETGSGGGSNSQITRYQAWLNTPVMSREESARILGQDFIRWRMTDPAYRSSGLANIAAGQAYLEQARGTSGVAPTPDTASPVPPVPPATPDTPPVVSAPTTTTPARPTAPGTLSPPSRDTGVAAPNRLFNFDLGRMLSDLAVRNNPSVITAIQQPPIVYNTSNFNGGGGASRPQSPRSSESSIQRAIQRVWDGISV